MEEEEELQTEKIKGNKRAGKGKSGKTAAGGTKPSRGKSKQNVVESTSGVKRSRSKLADESMIDVVGDDHDSAPGKPESPPPPKEVTPPPPPAKRRKLPTIKKNKIPGSAGPLTPVTTAKAVLPSQTVTAESTLLPTTSARKPAATAGNADFDLRNASVYAELFKTAGGSTPRSGLNRREKDEERRKELNKMRDEARAKRALEEIPAFDLQGQTEKIARFEEKLRNAQSSALYPNFLAAKWREQWEKERRKKRESEWTETDDRNGAKVKSGADERQKT
ncbi:hypothetical protein BD779DRAFT_853350 [Infundibulicybe gibba]|nr:hypothetical protein BD779DRAFT_853350 [Infundibulicybe gibba]